MTNLYGLIICGNQNSRTGKDKSLFDYHGKPQRYYLYEMLETLCEKVFLSCTREQATGIPGEYNVITDDPEYEAAGVMGSLLTAFKKHPKASFLVIGCDYPFINRHHLKKLVVADLETIPAISYYDKEREQFEPLIALYHNNIRNELKKHFKTGDYSLEQILQAVDAYTINAKSPDIIRNVTTNKEYKEVSELFRKFR